MSLSFNGIDTTFSSYVPIFKVEKTQSKNDANIVGVAYRIFGTSRCISSPENLPSSQSLTNSGLIANQTRDLENSQNSTENAANSSNLITGNVINELGLETDLSQILEPAGNETSADANASAPAINSSQPLPQLSDSNVTSGHGNNSNLSPAGIAEAGAESADVSNETITDEKMTITDTTYKYTSQTVQNNNVECDSNKIYKGEQLIIATHNSITFLKATNENGKILPGDYLTASSKAGYAAKADENSIVLIGRALEPLNSTEGKIAAFVQITNNNVLNINKERLLEKDNQELDELEEKYSVDLEEIKEEKSKQKTRLERTKEKLLTNVTVSAAASATPTPQIDYMTKVNGSIILRLG